MTLLSARGPGKEYGKGDGLVRVSVPPAPG
jgi:hypothetical protein